MAKIIEEGGRGTTLPENVGVLIVEPQKFQADIVRSALLGAGVGVDKIHEARDVTSALAVLKSMVPDIMITELDLPDATGEHLIQKAREMGVKAPILAVTSQGENTRVRDAVSAGVSDYILKPVSNEQITKRVARHLKKAGWDEPTEGPGRPPSVIRG